jgi:hypothetical protein
MIDTGWEDNHVTFLCPHTDPTIIQISHIKVTCQDGHHACKALHEVLIKEYIYICNLDKVRKIWLQTLNPDQQTLNP